MEFNKQTSAVKSSASEAIIDQGLRSYMLKVYNYMASGVLLTGFIALAFFKMAVVSDGGQIVGLTNFGNTIYASGLKWVIMLAPLAVVFYMSFGIAKMSAAKAQTKKYTRGKVSLCVSVRSDGDGLDLGKKKEA